jgi:hypothetical protein
MSTFSEERFVGVSEAEISTDIDHSYPIKNVIIPRDRYQPEGFNPRVDIGRGMIIVSQPFYYIVINILVTSSEIL